MRECSSQFHTDKCIIVQRVSGAEFLTFLLFVLNRCFLSSLLETDRRGTPSRSNQRGAFSRLCHYNRWQREKQNSTEELNLRILSCFIAGTLWCAENLIISRQAIVSEEGVWMDCAEFSVQNRNETVEKKWKRDWGYFLLSAIFATIFLRDKIEPDLMVVLNSNSLI